VRGNRGGRDDPDRVVKQVGFARRVRYEQLKALYEWAVQEDGNRDGYQRVEATAVGIDTARWWLDQQSLITHPTDLLELLDAAAATHAGQTCENTA